MILKNAELERIFELDDKIIIWGCGRSFQSLKNEIEKKRLSGHVKYIVDHGCKNQMTLSGRAIPIYEPEIIKKESKCTIIISSSEYLADIYDEIVNMNLSDSVNCYAWPFVRLLQSDEMLQNANKTLLDHSKELAPRIIHTFWFSGDPLPEEYQKCLNSWKKYCPDYEIKIWNQETYDCNNNQFVKDAIAARKWAFAADVARLDILYKYGGIYMDLDVEIFQPLDDMLCHNGVFFHLEDCIDMPVFSSVKGNEILKKIKNLYIDLEFSQDEDYQKNVLIQPRFVRSVFESEGVPMEEGVHKINGNLYLPRNMFLPLYWFDWSGKSKCGDAGYGIHHCNAGWFSDSTREERNQKIKKIAKLWDEIYQ